MTDTTSDATTDQLVFTIKGMVPLSQLRIVDRVEQGENYRKLVTTYYLGEEIVRQSAAVEAFRPIKSGADAGSMT